MKKILIVALLALVPLSSVLAQKSKTKAAANVPTAASGSVVIESAAPTAVPGQTFSWNETSHDFGKIEQGVPVTTEFKFTNTSKTVLVLANVQPSCGCTAADFSKSVAPGKTGYVKATFNAANVGPFTKSITVVSNAPEGNITLNIKGEVIAK